MDEPKEMKEESRTARSGCMETEIASVKQDKSRYQVCIEHQGGAALTKPKDILMKADRVHVSFAINCFQREESLCLPSTKGTNGFCALGLSIQVLDTHYCHFV